MRAREGNRGCPAARIANHELRLHGNFRYQVPAAFNLLQQGARRELPHFLQRLPHSYQRRVVMHRDLNIVEADHGNVLGNSQARLLESSNGANRGDVVVCKQRGKRPLPCQQRLCKRVAELRRRVTPFELDNQFGAQRNSELLGRFADRVPAELCV